MNSFSEQFTSRLPASFTPAMVLPGIGRMFTGLLPHLPAEMKCRCTHHLSPRAAVATLAALCREPSSEPTAWRRINFEIPMTCLANMVSTEAYWVCTAAWQVSRCVASLSSTAGWLQAQHPTDPTDAFQRLVVNAYCQAAFAHVVGQNRVDLRPAQGYDYWAALNQVAIERFLPPPLLPWTPTSDMFGEPRANA